jgi:signal transduction histidine kinase
MPEDLAERKEPQAVGTNPSTQDHWTEQYRVALHAYMAGGGEAALRSAHRIGRAALADGAGLLDVVILHHAALERVPATQANRSSGDRISGNFLAESLAPFEMAFRGYEEANDALKHVDSVLEQEAKRMAHLIHDEVGQLLFALHMALAELNRRVDPSLHPEMHVITKLALSMEEQIHQLSHELRPMILEDLGLVPALEFLARGIRERSGTRVTILAFIRDRLPLSVETTLYRVVHEALTNIVKHSKATRAEVILEEKEGTIQCSVRDNGIGCVRSTLDGNETDGLGLVGIRERVDSAGGTVHITSHPSRGTQIHIEVPLGGLA